MRPEELPKTDIWNLFEKCRNYNRQVGMYSDTDRNYRMYNGNQWAGLPQAPKKSIEPIQLNIIKPKTRGEQNATVRDIIICRKSM